MVDKLTDLEKRLKDLEDYVYNFEDFLPARSLVEKTKNYLEKLEKVTSTDLTKRFHIPDSRARKLIELFVSYGFLTKQEDESFKIIKEAYFKYDVVDPVAVNGGEHDVYFNQAVEIITPYDKVSSSLLQRRLSIGYARAARLLDQLEEAGYVGPSEGAKPREVIKRSK